MVFEIRILINLLFKADIIRFFPAFSPSVARTRVGRCDGNFVLLLAFQPITIQRCSQQCQAVL